ncbi:MAG TPA: Rmf/CrpP family protein [Methylobacterium sp.]|jgi:hypothetical protein
MAFPSTSPTTILAEGRQARYRGDAEGANPYPPGSEEHGLWLKGWREPDGAEAEAHLKGAATRPV